MTIDKSLKVKKGANRIRSVMTRGERLLKLQENDRWKEGDRVLGLPKVRVPKLALKKKKKVKKEEDGAAATPAAGAKAAGKPAGKDAAKGAKK